MDIELKQALLKAGINVPTPANWETGWEKSKATFPEVHDLYFINPEWIKQISAILEWPADARDVLLDGLVMFDAHPVLRQLAWLCRHLLFVDPPAEGAVPKRWPGPATELHPSADLFYAYVFLAGVPDTLALHEKRGIPLEITRATLADLPLWMNNHKQKNGRWGLDELQRTGWLYGHLRARLFRLGRLQFQFENFKHPFQVYQRNDDGRVVALAGNGQKFRPDGRFEGAGGISAGENAWTAVLMENSTDITGNPVDPRGYVRHETITLSRKDWTCLLMTGDPVLGVHIPAGASIKPDICGESFRQAAAFFSEHFPEFKGRVFTCTTWFFDPQFEQYLPSDSNILQFQQQFYLLPVPGADARQTFERVCGVTNLKPEDMPRRTSLQRAVADHIIAGGQWYITGGFMLKDHVPRWGNAGL